MHASVNVNDVLNPIINKYTEITIAHMLSIFAMVIFWLWYNLPITTSSMISIYPKIIIFVFLIGFLKEKNIARKIPFIYESKIDIATINLAISLLTDDAWEYSYQMVKNGAYIVKKDGKPNDAMITFNHSSKEVKLHNSIALKSEEETMFILDVLTLREKLKMSGTVVTISMIDVGK